MADEYEFDVVVIGAGPAGYVCAIRAAQLGLETACVEAENYEGGLGGTCLNWGCIPAKAMLESASLAHRVRDQGESFGVKPVEVEYDVSAAVDRSRQISEKLTGGITCGGSYAFVTDPDGHEIEIVERDHGARWSLDHTMIRVEDADAAMGWYARKLEYAPAGRWESDSFANYFVAPPDAPAEAMDVELTYNYDGRSYETGDAWGHLAVRVDDLHEAWETLVDRGAEDYRDPASCDDRYAFTKDVDGHEIEIVTE